MKDLKELGVIIIPDFISREEEKEILALVARYPGDNKAKGPARMFRFGQLVLTEGIVNDVKAFEHGYKAGRRSYGEMNDGIDVSVVEIPEVLKRIGLRLFSSGIIQKLPPIYVINKYLKGQRIGKHIDHLDNGPTIPVVGLKSDTVMVLSKGEEKIEIPFPARSLLVLSGESRYEWFHSIKACKDVRYSLVVRNLPK